jgi:hypothetical protein
MAKKSTPKTEAPKVAPAKKTSTPVRNTAIPKTTKSVAAAAAAIVEPTYDQIAKRAYEIYASGTGGSESDNWLRAERELRSGV